MSILRIGVLMGGKGPEREVSFNSGRTVCDHLDSSYFSTVPLYQRSDGTLFFLPWRFLHRGKTSDFEHRLDKEAEKITWDSLKEHIDFIYIALHGSFAEDGTVQGFLEILGIPYLGAKVLASALSMNKAVQKSLLKCNGIAVPRGITINPDELESPDSFSKRLAQEKLSLPYIVKPNQEGSSLGITVVFNQEELIDSVLKAAHSTDKRQAVIIEECIKGAEFSYTVVADYQTGYKELPPTEIVLESGTCFFDYEQKYMPGRGQKFTPARFAPELLEKIQETCIQVTKILDIKTLARIDGFVTEKEIVIIDINTLCGMAPSSMLFRQAAEIGMSPADIINHFIKTELAHYGMSLTSTGKETTMQEVRKRVGILMGGRSSERETSLDSGRNVFYKLSSQKYEPIALFIDENFELFAIDQALFISNTTGEIKRNLKPSMKIAWSDLSQHIDFAFIALHGGEGENGCVQGTLEMLGIPYNGSSVLTSALCIDKYKTAQFLQAEGFDVPQGHLLTKENWQNHKTNKLEAQLSFPLIVKPHNEGCSELVLQASNKDELIKAIEKIFSKGKNAVLIEEYIQGMELTVGVIGNTNPRALPPSQALSATGILSLEEKFLPGGGENQTPAPLPSAALSFIMKVIENVYKTLNCKGYARIDCFYQADKKGERLVILEVNTLPGLTPATCFFHQAAEIGIQPAEFIDLIIKLGCEEHEKSPVQQGTVPISSKEEERLL